VALGGVVNLGGARVVQLVAERRRAHHAGAPPSPSGVTDNVDNAVGGRRRRSGGELAVGGRRRRQDGEALAFAVGRRRR